MKTARITVLLVIAVMLLAAVPVSAGAPKIEEWNYDQFSQWTWAPCDFPIWEHEVLSARTMTYYDKDGLILREVTYFHGNSTFTNPANPDVELVTKTINAAFSWDAVNEHWDATGLTAHVNLPGYGTVIVRAGRWSNYPFGHDAGKDSFDNEADKEAFCAYMAGN